MFATSSSFNFSANKLVNLSYCCFNHFYVSLYKDPEGNKVFFYKTTPSDDPTLDMADVQHLQVRVLELEK